MSQLHLDNEDYRWLADALGGAGDTAPHRVLARPSAAAPELFIPLRTAAAGAASLRRFHDGRSRNELAKTLGAIALARLDLLRLAPGQIVDIGPFELVDRLAERLGEEDLVFGITLGPRRRNRKPVLQLLRPDGRTIGFAKVGWSPLTRALVDNEAHWLERLRPVVPSQLRIPDVLTRIEDDTRTVLVVSALETSPRSGSAGRLSPDTIMQLARSLGTEISAVADLPYLDQLRQGRVGTLIDVDRLAERHSEATLELGIWHGDLTPWNTSTVGGVSSVWDWEFADRHRPVGFDLLHTAFESVRRQARQNEPRALNATRDRADTILAPSDQPTAATFDLYLCELIMREARLKDEGWDPSGLGPLEDHAVTMLRERLA
jgi:hypothetical protein